MRLIRIMMARLLMRVSLFLATIAARELNRAEHD
jgi:hypothetical protein